MSFKMNNLVFYFARINANAESSMKYKDLGKQHSKCDILISF